MIQFEISDHADQKFSSILNNKRVTIRLRYNVTNDRWAFDMAVDDLPVLHGRKIVTGVDLIAPFNLGIGAFFAMTTTGDDPDRNALPDGTVRLYSATDEEVAAAAALD